MNEVTDEDLVAWMHTERTDKELFEEAFQALVTLPRKQQFALMLYLTRKTVPVLEMKLFSEWVNRHKDLKI